MVKAFCGHEDVDKNVFHIWIDLIFILVWWTSAANTICPYPSLTPDDIGVPPKKCRLKPKLMIPTIITNNSLICLGHEAPYRSYPITKDTHGCSCPDTTLVGTHVDTVNLSQEVIYQSDYYGIPNKCLIYRLTIKHRIIFNEVWISAAVQLYFKCPSGRERAVLELR